MVTKTLMGYSVAVFDQIDQLKLHINIDGFPLFKSSKRSGWPVLCSIVNLNPVNVFPISVGIGQSKPSNLDFLADSIAEINHALKEGITYQGKHFQVALQCVVCDAPARAMNILACDHFNLFLVLSTAICILVSTKLAAEHVNYAHQLLKYYIKWACELYGQEFAVYNVHGLLHIADDVIKFGCLDNCSAWRFENYMNELKKKVRSGKNPAAQLVKRIYEETDRNNGIQYSVVIFLKDNIVECVPSSWIEKSTNKLVCYWPSGKDLKRKILKQEIPDKDLWDAYPVKLVGKPEYKDYEFACRIAKRAEETSTVESEDDDQERSRKRPSRYISPDEYDEADGYSTDVVA
ncbi:hypothetical protein BSL78_27286 [Apostichopus japonicus]|uniref:Uncharacterized protein n=1 Tax=Stichopus japonicus TaxID=307972 RepID=A0A2G8JJF6_STIJA|nr:hypothetical protein BSL78_27286 [Apostichopus japonicus]